MVSTKSNVHIASLMVVWDMVRCWNYTHAMIERGLLLQKVLSHLYECLQLHNSNSIGYWYVGVWQRKSSSSPIIK